MSAILVCSTAADSLSYIDLNDMTVKKILFNLSEKPVGPHSLKSYDNIIITANNYNDSVSLFDKNSFKEIKSIKTGPKPNDVLIKNNKIYTICGESNSLEVYDIYSDRKNIEVPTGNWPHSMDFIPNKNLIVVSNLEDDSVVLINEKTYEVIGKINAPEYPTKVKISNNNKNLYVCESYLGSDYHGFLDVFNTENFQRECRIKVGGSPVDMYEDNFNIYVSNFTDGSITIIEKSNYKVNKTVYIGGMPKGVIKVNESLYVIDYLKSRIINIYDDKIKNVIAIEAEPNAMTLF